MKTRVPTSLENASRLFVWFALAFTFAYRAGIVCLCGTKGIWTRKYLVFANPSCLINPWGRGLLPPLKTHHVFGIICVCLYFSLPSWICISVWNSGDVDSEAFCLFSKSLSLNQPIRTWVPTSLENTSSLWNHMCLRLLLMICHFVACLMDQEELQWSTCFCFMGKCMLTRRDHFVFKVNIFVIISACLFFWLCLICSFAYWMNRNCNGVHLFHWQMYANS